MRVEIWSDIVCPWCYIGKRRFETALSSFEQRDDVEVLYRSYELDPNAPRSSGLDNYTRLARKYGMTIEQARQRSAQVAEAGAQDGLLFDFDNVKQSNSFDAHHRFEDACHDRGIRFAVVERIGGIEWACPDS